MRIFLVALLTAATTSGLAVMINLATSPAATWPYWVAVAVLTVIAAVIAWRTTSTGGTGSAEFTARDVHLSDSAEVRPRKGTAVRTRNFTARGNAKFVVEDSADDR